MLAAFRDMKNKMQSPAFKRDLSVFQGVFSILRRISPITFGLILPLSVIYALLLPYLLWKAAYLLEVGGSNSTNFIYAIFMAWFMYFLAVFLSSLYSVAVISEVNQLLRNEKPGLLIGMWTAIREIINIFFFAALSAGFISILLAIGKTFTPKSKAGEVTRSAIFTSIGTISDVGMSFVGGLYPSVITVERLDFVSSLHKLVGAMKSNLGKKILASAKLTVFREVISTAIFFSLPFLIMLVLILFSGAAQNGLISEDSWWLFAAFFPLGILGLFLAYTIFMDSVAAVFLAVIYKYQRTSSLPDWLPAGVKSGVAEFAISKVETAAK